MKVAAVLDALQKEWQKFTQSDETIMQGYVDVLIECGEYPGKLTPVMTKQGTTHLGMVQGYGAYWHRWREPLTCHHCEADLRNHESGPPFKREIGIYSLEKDRTTGFKCPDCEQMISEN